MEKKYIEHKGFLIEELDNGVVRTYRIVDKIPRGYQIWNIGKNIKDGYLPLCKVDKDYHVDSRSLLVVKTKHAQTILSAVGIVGDSVVKMKRYIANHDDIFSERMKKAIPLLEKLRA